MTKYFIAITVAGLVLTKMSRLEGRVIPVWGILAITGIILAILGAALTVASVL